MILQCKMGYLVVRKKKQSVAITICYHSASLMMTISDPDQSFFDPILIIDLYTLIKSKSNYTLLTT